MGRRGIAARARFALGYPGFLRARADLAGAERAVRARIESRAARFLELARSRIYSHDDSPYNALLRHAGWAPADLERRLGAVGLEATLGELCDAGVRVSLDEFKCRSPIVRDTLELRPGAHHFDNPAIDGGLGAASSGSRSTKSHVVYGWDFLAEEAEEERLLFEAHGLHGAPGAYWMPALPSISGIHNLLIQLRLGHPPVRWYSQVREGAAGGFAMAYVDGLARLHGLRAPRPRFADPGGALPIARWLSGAARAHGRAWLKAFASSALRVAGAAREHGIDLEGVTVFTGGEPLTLERRAAIEASGARAYARYVTTETGLIAGACPECASPDSMHVYTDRIAVVRVPGTGRLHITSLSLTTGKILLNADMGDAGELEVRDCACPMGRLGMNLMVSAVRSAERLTGEGMSLQAARLLAIVGDAVAAAGGGPEDWQLRESTDRAGVVRLTIAVAPSVAALKDAAFLDAVLGVLAAGSDGERTVADFWRQAGTLRLVREAPALSEGGKQLPLLRVRGGTDG